MENTEPTLTQFIKNAIRSQLMDLHTCLPAKVVKYNPSARTVNVKIGVKRKYFGQDASDYPEIPDVPIRFSCSSGGKALIRMPIKKGDTGLLLFSERSLEKWLIAKDTVDPDDPRVFDLSDATFAPDLVQDYMAPVKNEDSLGVSYDKMAITLHPDGKIEIKGATEEFVSLMYDFVGEMISAKTITSLGPQPFTVDTITKLSQLQAKIGTLKK